MLGVTADALFADPRRGHPVAGFGRAAAGLERRMYADSRRRGATFVAASAAVPILAGWAIERGTSGRPALKVLATAVATWTVLGGASLASEGEQMASLLEDGDLAAARGRLRNLCAREASGLDGGQLARATVESLAENASDAVVAPLLWGAVAGVPGLLGYRAVNTLDAMVGYRSSRYLRFGWAAARVDDLANLVPARVTGLIVVACAPAVNGSARAAWRVLRRDGAAHPSPNAGRPEAAAAGALGVRLGGSNVYPGHVEDRPTLGDGRGPGVADIRRSVRLVRLIGTGATAFAVLVAVVAQGRGGLAPRS